MPLASPLEGDILKYVRDQFRCALRHGSVLDEEVFRQICDRIPNNHELAQKHWKERPRTLAILASIEAESALKAFEDDGLHDISIPYSETELPQELRDRNKSRQFLKNQSMVFSAREQFREEKLAPNLHLHAHEAEKYFEAVSYLGKGGYGSIESVRIRGPEGGGDGPPGPPKSTKTLARKMLLRDKSYPNSKTQMRHALQEIHNLRRLSLEAKTKPHHHIVKLEATYTDSVYFALLMSPVAESDLSDSLLPDSKLTGDSYDRNIDFLRASFGCLANALDYLHNTVQMRHRDIKPQNILVYKDRVLLCDFGISKDWHDAATTSGPPAGTSRYSAPESKQEGRSHDLKADIFSLGCVFVEIWTVVQGSNLAEMEHFLNPSNDDKWAYSDHVSRVSSWISKLKNKREWGHHPAIWIKDMKIRQDATERASARSLLDDIREDSSDELLTSYIGRCCSVESTRTSSPIPEYPDQISENDPVQIVEPSIEILDTHVFPIFKASLNEFTAEHRNMEDTRKPITTRYAQCDLVLSENEARNSWETQRSLQIYGRGRDDELYYRSWLPYTDVEVQDLSHSQLELRWSNCDHPEKERQGRRTKYSRVYKPEDPNRTVVLTFDNPDVAKDFRDTVQFPKHDRKLKLRETIALSTTDDTCIAKIYDTGIEDLTAVCMIVGTSNSKLLFVLQEIDLDFQFSTHELKVLLNQIGRPSYRSNMTSEYSPEPKKRAHCESASLMSNRAEILLPHKSDLVMIGAGYGDRVPQELKEFFSTVSGWALRYLCGAKVNTHSSSFKIMTSTKRLGSADVMLWEKHDGPSKLLRMALRVKNVDSEKDRWIAGEDPTNIQTHDKRLMVELSNITWGQFINIYKMKVENPVKEKASGIIELKFAARGLRHDFEAIMEQFRRQDYIPSGTPR